jgi:hypothetical protein
MDQAGDKGKLENERAMIESYLSHPITRKIISDNKEEQEKLVNLICAQAITDVETFFAHHEAVGHLRGLRRAEAIIRFDLEEIKEKLEEL